VLVYFGVRTRGPPDKKATKMPPPDKSPRRQKATTLVFHWTNLKSPDYVFTYSTADEIK